MTPGRPFTWLAERFDHDGDVGVLGSFLIDDGLVGGDLPEDGLTLAGLVAHLRARGARQAILAAAPGAWSAYVAEHPGHARDPHAAPTAEHREDTDFVPATEAEERLAHRLEKRFSKDGGPR